MFDRESKLARELKKQMRNCVRGQKGPALIESGEPLAFLSYVQIPPASRSRGKSWPDKLEDELAQVLINTNIRCVWMDKMKYPDIVTLGVASGLKPYASPQGYVIVRGAFGHRYAPYHFVASCGSYMEMVVQHVMETGEEHSTLRWTASSRLWPSAEVAVGVMHGRILPTRPTVDACKLLLDVLNRAITMLNSPNSTVEQDMGFSFFRKRVRCKACGHKNRVPDVVDWTAVCTGVIVVRDRVQTWLNMIVNCNGGVAGRFLQDYIVGPMWTADCYEEKDRVPVASLTHFLWLQAGTGGTELARHLEKLVNKPEALTERLLACVGPWRHPRFWYETYEKMIDRIVVQLTLSRSTKHGTQTDEWANAVWFYPTEGAGFFGDLTFSPGKKLVMDAFREEADVDAIEISADIIVSQQRSLWPVVGGTLPWYFTECEGEEVVLVPAMHAPRMLLGQLMGQQLGRLQYVLEAEMPSNELVVQIPIGGNIKAVTFSRAEQELYYIAFVMKGERLSLRAMRPCHSSVNTSWCNIEPTSVVYRAQGHTPEQGTMYGANGMPRDYRDMYKTWAGQAGFRPLGVLDRRAVFDESLEVGGGAADNSERRAVGWNWLPVPDQESAIAEIDPHVVRVLSAWKEVWL
ncbi:unnamed protein product [Chondrus crispus]|uniref:Uncharacterized protein n=1 Tax=Chondrus crispus TaxID=2769 RepID=R7Q7Z1_CHOCR|nr:unnamed protein product [Chondrus crispus]CDF33938.1 unnamed protein product [Chondrus crispus]|eukprot:XP_005713757.1 unnamed protein product [Chondrus crispus]